MTAREVRCQPSWPAQRAGRICSPSGGDPFAVGPVGVGSVPECEDVLVPAELTGSAGQRRSWSAMPGRMREAAQPSMAAFRRRRPAVACAPGGLRDGDGRRHGLSPVARAGATPRHATPRHMIVIRHAGRKL